MRSTLDYLIYLCAMGIIAVGAIGSYDAITAPVEAGLTAAQAPHTFDVLPEPFPGRDRVTLLLIGADDRPHEPGRSDTMILVFLNPRNHQAAMLSVPRDLKVPIPGHGSTKINASYAYGGVELTRRTIQQVFGVHIDYYAKADFKGFVEIVDTLGGVEVEVPDVEGGGRGMNYDDNWDNLHIHLKPGWQRLDGKQAIGFVRYRKSNTPGLGDGDFGRAARQQQFLKAMVEQKLRLSNALQLARVAPKVLRWVDTDMSVREAAELALVLKDVKQHNLLQVDLQPYLRDYRTSEGWFVLCSDEGIRSILDEIDQHLRSSPASGLQVTVLNGCGRAGVAAAAGERLSREGFLVETDNADSFNYRRTVIRYTLGQRALAQAVRRTLGVGELEELGPDRLQSPTQDALTQDKLVVIVGEDFSPQTDQR